MAGFVLLSLLGVLVVRPTSLKRGEGHLVGSLRMIVEFGEARARAMVMVGMNRGPGPTSTG